MSKTIVSALFCLFFTLASGKISQAQIVSTEWIKQTSKEHLRSAVDELDAFLRVPNNGRYPDHVEENVKWCLSHFQGLMFQTQRLETDGVPLVFAEYINDKEKPTVLFYLQIDGQPVDTTKWDQENPYVPVLKRESNGNWIEANSENLDLEQRLFARSAADSKGPAMAFMTAIKIFRENGLKADYNLKVIMDFQEELGSPDLPAAVERYKEFFKADMMIIMDGTRFLNNKPTLTFGARGIARITLKVFGAKNNLHSGHYGNFSPNPVFGLSKLIAGMKDDSGRVLIPGYYDGISIADEEKELMDEDPKDINRLKKENAISTPDKVAESYQESLAYPSLNVRGLKAAWVGKEVRTIIPNEAVAELDLRLVPETDGQRQVDLIRSYVSESGYHILDHDPTDTERIRYPKLASFTYNLGSKAFRTDLNSTTGKWLDGAMLRVFGKGNYVKLRTTGGSQPIAPFINTLGVPAVSVRIPDPASQIHGPNENIRIGNFLEGIQMCLAILSQEFN